MQEAPDTSSPRHNSASGTAPTPASSAPADSARTNKDVVRLDLEGPAHGGSVIARLDGHVVFVRGGLPGERGVPVTLDPLTSQKFRTGQAIDLASADKLHTGRVAGQCPAARLGAGCCDLDFADGPTSLEFKKAVVLDQLRRVGGFGEEDLAADSITATSLTPQAGYRTRIRVGVDNQGRPGIRKARSRELIPLSQATCAQWHPELVAQLPESGLPANTDLAASLSGGSIGDDARVSLVTLGGGKHGAGRRASRQRSRKRWRTELTGPVIHHVGEVQWCLPADAFWQGHPAAPAHYRKFIAAHVPQAERGHAWDLYGGAGVFAAGLAEVVGHGGVTSVDIAGSATREGQRALDAAGIAVNFLDSDVESALPGLIKRLDPQDGLHAVVLDPPRAGAGRAVIEQVASAQPRHVIHIACDPATGARDLGYWRDAGYEVQRLEVVDAFGLTHHVETLAYLTPVELKTSACGY